MNNNPTSKLKTYNLENIAVIEMVGNIQQTETDELEELLYTFFENQKRNIILDLQNVNQVCSTALGLLVRFKQFLNENGGELKMVFCNPQLIELFKVTMMDRIFETSDSLQEAISSF
ncbi:MAG: STAS domain-containing protein [Spirochaetia bacterium]|nr:STAS domain-containing protein [Spirochaetia bacterium]